MAILERIGKQHLSNSAKMVLDESAFEDQVEVKQILKAPFFLAGTHKLLLSTLSMLTKSDLCTRKLYLSSHVTSDILMKTNAF